VQNSSRGHARIWRARGECALIDRSLKGRFRAATPHCSPLIVPVQCTVNGALPALQDASGMPAQRRFAFFSRAKDDVSGRFYPSREIGNKTFQSVVGNSQPRRLGTLRSLQAGSRRQPFLSCGPASPAAPPVLASSFHRHTGTPFNSRSSAPFLNHEHPQ